MLLAGLILLAACANLGSLFAARAADRSKEVAMRLALGSSRGRITRQLLTEATMVSHCRRLAWAGRKRRPAALAQRVASFAGVSDQRAGQSGRHRLRRRPVLALVSGLIFGMVPVRQVLAINPYQVIKVRRHLVVGRRFTVRDLLLVSQIAICAVLVTASLVAVRGLVRSLHSNFGFVTQNAMLLSTDLGMARYSAGQQPVMQRRMRGCRTGDPRRDGRGFFKHAAAQSGSAPLDGVCRHGHGPEGIEGCSRTLEFSVSPGYFEAAGTTLLAGRSLTWHDDKNAPRVAVVNQEFARQVFGSAEKAIGGHFKRRDGIRIEVVGVAEDGKYESLTEDTRPAMFYSILQSPSSHIWLIVRSNRDPRQLTAATLHQATA